ncbi:aminoacyl-histidine dipeptidase [Erysipelothrix larvae]|uniref:Cytosol non-specific dipeptidase n=1 Tax=Erysipelothrix larvae TaxID=1514105 RepID=A0A120JTL5_9FIRM|nr:beta-Ala-His dipeptidase [Erysipelothrix larvae]AMC93243.1 aminoacyl-histidine dipeptidase [Erysipelothrix larvae]
MSESRVLELFRNISDIPRASFDEKRISDYIAQFGKDLGLETVQDEFLNVIIKKDATPGYENVPAVLLQSHMDMVAEKNKDSNHNFETDPLTLHIEEGHLWADNTTLGADDGVGVVYMLAILEDHTLQHPALECVFTVQEEVGLIGADKLDTSNLKAELMVGLDSSGENVVCVSSSGGVRTSLTAPVDYEDGHFDTLKIGIRGLKGGHSGGLIHKERGNALKLAGIILRRALDQFDLRLRDIEGGLKINAICREVDFEIALDDKDAFKVWFSDVQNELKQQYEFSDPDLYFVVEEGHAHHVLTASDTCRVIDLLFMLPYGVIQKSMAIEDLVITSANIGTVKIENNELEICVSIRATQGFVLENIMRQVEWLADILGVNVSFNARYPGWNYEKDSKFREQLKRVYKDMRGNEMIEEATHGGLELGIFKDKMPQLDIVNCGPIMYDIHTPQEHLDIASFDRTYEVLVALLKSLSEWN